MAGTECEEQFAHDRAEIQQVTDTAGSPDQHRERAWRAVVRHRTVDVAAQAAARQFAEPQVAAAGQAEAGSDAAEIAGR